MWKVWNAIGSRSGCVLIASVAIGMAFFLSVNLLIDKIERQGIRAQNEGVTRDLRNLRSELEGIIHQSIYLTYGIQAHVAVAGDIASDTFTALSQQLVKHSSSVRNISLIKGHELIMVHPLSGNEGAIGLRFDKHQKDGFNKAIRVKGTVLLGPINLVQGGTGLIARTPVYVNDQDYWGQTAVVLDWDVIQQRVGLREFMQMYHLDIASSNENGTYSHRVVGNGLDYSSGGNVLLHHQSEYIAFPQSSWRMQASPKTFYQLPWRGAWMLLVAVMSMGMSFFIFRYLSQVGDLHHQKQLALQLSDSKSQLLLSTVHDLRQPVNALSITLDQLHAPDSETDLERAKHCIGSINEFFDQLVGYEQLETGKLIATKEPFCLSALLASLVKELQPLAQPKGLQLVMQSSESHVVFSDRILLRRVMRNLMTNAIDNTAEGGVSISTISSDDDVSISISDTGRGIPKRELSHVTEPFYQVSKPSERGGAGLGLDIVNRLCRLLDVEFSLQSEEGVGSCATIRVPISHHFTEANTVTGSVPVRLLEETPLPKLLEDKFGAWGVKWNPGQEALMNLLVTTSNLEQLHSDHRFSTWRQPTLVLSNTVTESLRLNDRVWVLPMSHPVSIIRRTLVRIVDDETLTETLQ